MQSLKSVTLLLLFVVSAAHLSLAQDKFRVYVAAGDTAVNHGNFYGAHQSYKKALEIREDIDVAWKCAEVCRGYQNYPEAENFYRLTLSEDSAKYPQAFYWYAEMLKYQGKYKLAANAFKDYYKVHKLDKDYLSKKAKYEQKVCSDSVYRVDTIRDIRLSRLNDNINTSNSELSTYIYRDSILFFGSVRPVPGDSNSYFSKIYMCLKTDKEWGTAQELPKIVNEPQAHVNNITFTRDGKTAYFSKCALADHFICNIFQASYSNGQFSDVKKLPDIINKAGFTTTQPHLSISPKGETLFFSSDRTGGKGGRDIWYSRINKDGSFATPVNCGAGVNTLGDDITPFYDSRDSLLYFSSEWNGSLGGFDVFKSKGDVNSSKWAKATNVGKPVNSSYNDMYFTFGKDSVQAYFTSNRPESHRFIDQAYGNDIYTYEMVQKAIDKIKELVPLTLYFDNDMPDPRSQDTATVTTYEGLVMDYLTKKDEFLEQNGRGITDELEKYNRQVIETLFSENIEKGWVDLFLFAELLEVILHDGQDIVVTFKGYTSPLANTEYNEKLAKRRISCVKNFFDQFSDGVFNNFVNNEPKSGKGSLKYNQVPIGETVPENLFKVNGEAVNLDELESRKNIKKSIYSPAACLQRKIEILAIEIEKEKQQDEEIQEEIQSTKKKADQEFIPEE